MSLSVAAHGILKTHLTWDEVEHELQKAFNTNAHFGPNKSATSIGDLKFHNREVDMYKILMKLNEKEIPFTEIYAAKKFDDQNNLKGFIISEYIPNIRHIGMHECMNYNDIIKVVKSAAIFSAIGNISDKEELKFAEGENMLTLLMSQVIDESPVLIHCDLWSSNLLCDLWSSNLLCTRRPNDGAELKAIIDFQTVSFGSPGIDLARLFVSSLSSKDRNEHLDDLLNLYYDTFESKLQGSKPSYTMEQLKDSYYLCVPLFTLPGIVPQLELSNVASSELKKERKIAMSKMIGLVEDSLAAHEINVKNHLKMLINNN
ncbi:unnamed protein product [Caenorhabditis bovis]|uniref:CHK kinase-like domain-containing protein n=1 Tax=Caenorhabditis bovis TaxID=2654633 RepID=A0A8S1E593_9PELO|nr:unnamed protein product [Caenorhabditis bovis]